MTRCPLPADRRVGVPIIPPGAQCRALVSCGEIEPVDAAASGMICRLFRHAVAVISVRVLRLKPAERSQIEPDLQGRVIMPSANVNVRTLGRPVIPDLRDALPCPYWITRSYFDPIHVAIQHADPIFTTKHNRTRSPPGMMAWLIGRRVEVDAVHDPIERRQDISPPAIPVFVSCPIVCMEAIPTVDKSDHPAVAP